MPVLSTRNSTLPALISLTALATSNVTVPVFGLGISPRGPSTLPRRPADFIMSGVAITASKSVQPSWIFWTMSSPPTKSAPASCASRTFSPLAITSTRFDLPRPCGSTTVPRTIWSDCFGSTPRFKTSSTVSSNFAKCALRRSSAVSSSRYGRASTSLRARSIFLPPSFELRPIAFLSCCLNSRLRFDFDSHVAGGAHYRANRRFEVRGVQVGQFYFRNFGDLLLCDLRNFVAVWLRRPLHDSSGALQKLGSGRRLQNEGKGAVAVDRHQNRNNHSVRLFRRLRVELLAEIHDVHAVGAKRRAHGRRRRRFRRWQLQLHHRLNFFGHD